MASNAENVSNRWIINVFVNISIPISEKGWATFRKLKLKMVRHTTGGVITWYVLFGKTSVYTIHSLWPSGDIDFGQHWPRWWLVSWGHQATTWCNVDLLSLKFTDIHLRAILQDMSHINQSIIWEIFTFSSKFPRGQWIPGHVAWRQLLGYFSGSLLCRMA